MKKIGLVALIALLIVTIAWSFLGIGKGEESYKVGVLAPLTGEGATYGESMRRGIELALRDREDVKLVYEDTMLSASTGVSATTKLVSLDDVDVIYGAAASGVSKAVLPIADKDRTLLFSSISTSDSLSIENDSFFRNVPSNNIQGHTAADFLVNSKGLKKLAIFNENDEYGVNLAESFRSKVKELGGEIVFDDAYSADSSNFSTSLQKIKLSEAEAVFIPGNYEESSQILKQAYELEIDSIFIGGDGSYSPKLIENARSSAEGFMCTVMTVDKSTDFYKTFYSKFVDKYDQEPDVYDAYAYEAGAIISQAMDIASKNDSKDFIKIFKENRFDGFTKEVSFNAYGDIDRSYGVVTVKGGEFVD